MKILIVGNVLNDIYLNLDDHTENFETDRNNTRWLDLSFDASEHHFFSRESNLGGAAVTFEVLSKLGLNSKISNFDIVANENHIYANQPADSYRYILISKSQTSYFSPTNHVITSFETPNDFYDFIFVDRSANLDNTAAKKINTYLDLSPNTKLVLYVQNLTNQNLNQLISRSVLIFREKNNSHLDAKQNEILNIPPEKIIYLSESNFSYLDHEISIANKRIDMFTHLSFYSIASATILGSFILGNTVDDALNFARINVENSKLNTSLSLAEIQNSHQKPHSENLNLIAANLVLQKKGILAADESGGSIKKKFAQLNIPDTAQNRRDYRNIFLDTPNLNKYVNGVILFEETAYQFADNGQNFVDFLTSKQIIPGIKVDQGLAPISELNPNYQDSTETYTKGLDGLDGRLKKYYATGLRFAKWRAAFNIELDDNSQIITPSEFAISENCRILAEYAKTCQANNIVPIVEPEVVYDGNYSIEDSAKATSQILDCLFKKLTEHQVELPACILKVNMILAGKQFATQSTSSEIGQKTAEVLLNHVPKNLAGVVFLSGGQTPEQATENLASVIKNGPFPWPVTFSFARALQDPALYAWQGDNKNTTTARQAFEARLAKNTEVLP